MKKLIFIIPALCIVLVACNNSENKTAETPGTKTMQADSVKQADSLEKEVMDGHNVGMARMSKMSKLQQEARRLIDSLDKLPAKAKEAARPYRGKLESLVNNLEDAKASGCKKILIATDGVFSMDGYIANLPAICDLADEFDALTMVDDSHAVGFMGEHGKGTPEHCGVMGRVDIITGTFGKALGGASGGFTAARQPIVTLLRQRSRPYLFSNTVAPAICAATIRTIELLEESTALRDKVHENGRYFREKMEALGFDMLPGEHPIVPVMLYDPKVAHEFARRMLEKGVYVVAFCYPVVPKGKDRIRTQISAGHTKEDLDFAVECFRQVREEMGLK
jgi:glycine C-acetyltransferase